MALLAQPAWLDIAFVKEAVLVFFVVLFVGIALRLVLSRSRRYERAAQIPLHDDKVVTERKDRSPDDRDRNEG